MRIALIARPQWETTSSSKGTARLRDAPLQQLRLCSPDAQALQAIRIARNPWVVFTSPASAEAMDQWIQQTGINPMRMELLRVAAVGSGTRNAILDIATRHSTHHRCAWNVAAQDITIATDDDRADAAALLNALDALQREQLFVWKDQAFFLAQGENNRSTLADGLTDRGAHVTALAIYRRCDVPWTEDIWELIRQCPAGECGVVVTSSTVIARLMADLASHGVAIPTLAWCTQHAAIAERLMSAGVNRVRRVSLDPAKLEGDLYEHEQYW